MTREEAKNIVKGITDKIESTTDIDDWAEFWGFTREDYEDFLEMSIKTLEQEPKKGRTIDADELLKRISEKAKIPSLSEATVNGLCGATAIIYDMLNESEE